MFLHSWTVGQMLSYQTGWEYAKTADPSFKSPDSVRFPDHAKAWQEGNNDFHQQESSSPLPSR